ncbi:hypothetical protein YH62_05505 [Rhizobium sp. LC145]|jgi:hypothetical protein|nr:hypothetical protein YH62_05505 [Rhizobium sp. LC145]
MRSVGVIRRDEKWVVQVNDDQQFDEREFAIESNAIAWAAGHRKRLGLPAEQAKQTHEGSMRC